MTDKQPEALELADELLEPMEGFPEPTTLEKNAAALLRAQHADIERKDALLRQALETLENDVQLHCYLPSRQHHLQTISAINSELSQ